jgi:hypothetical protein
MAVKKLDLNPHRIHIMQEDKGFYTEERLFCCGACIKIVPRHWRV